MSLKWIGAIFVMTGCGGFGFIMAAAQKREETCLRQLLRALDYMDCDLQYRQTSLPQLARNVSNILSNSMSSVFQRLAYELEQQVAPDAGCCMNAAVAAFPGLNRSVRECLWDLGKTLGQFDLSGQLKGIQAVKVTCNEAIQALSENRASRLRSYQTLGLCAGAALAILFL